MIILDTSTALEVVLGAAVSTNELEFQATYADTEQIDPGPSKGTTNGTTDVTLVSAPGSTDGMRLIKQFTVFNSDTVTATVTIKLDDGANERTLIERDIQPGQTLCFDAQAGGWYIAFRLDATELKVQSWIQEDGLYIGTDQVRARDGDGLLLTDDGGNGLKILDGGTIQTYPGGYTLINQSDLDSHTATSDAHHSRYTDSEAVSAVNNDADHGSTAQHDYYTDSDVDAHLSGGDGISYSAGTISTDDPNIDHDNLKNFLAAEHIDWTNDVSATYTLNDKNVNKTAVTQYTYLASDLGLGTAADESDTRYAHRSNNLSDLDYSQPSDPSVDTNPDSVGATWINHSSGEIFVCVDNTTDKNWWVGQISEKYAGGSGPGPQEMVYDATTDTGYYGYVGSGGEPTYDSNTTYSTGDIVNDGNDEFYRSKTDSNTGNSLPAVESSNTNWEWIGRDVIATGDTLASDIGLSAGAAQYSSEGYFKFFIGANFAGITRHGTVSAKDRVIFVAKKSYRYNLSWDNIYQAGAVYGTGDNGTASDSGGGTTTQDAQVTYSGYDFRVRLLTGCKDDPSPLAYDNTGCSDDVGDTSEWNDLFYRIHTDAPTCSDPTVGMPGGYETTRHGGPQDESNWADYPDEEVQVYNSVSGDGTACWHQEQGNDTTRRVYRGYHGVAHFHATTADGTSTNYGWRPCLELIQP